MTTPKKPIETVATTEGALSTTRTKCGLVTPISPNGQYEKEHWASLRKHIEAAATAAGVEVIPVWTNGESSIIPREILHNLRTLPICICVVTGWNPNVMFELGCRIAFDKHVIIVKDEATPFAFDVSVVDHVIYPTSFTWDEVETFRMQLKEKLTPFADLSGVPSVEKTTVLRALGLKVDEPKSLASFEDQQQMVSMKLSDLQSQIQSLFHEINVVRNIVSTQQGAVGNIAGTTLGSGVPHANPLYSHIFQASDKDLQSFVRAKAGPKPSILIVPGAGDSKIVILGTPANRKLARQILEARDLTSGLRVALDSIGKFLESPLSTTTKPGLPSSIPPTQS